MHTNRGADARKAPQRSLDSPPLQGPRRSLKPFLAAAVFLVVGLFLAGVMVLGVTQRHALRQAEEARQADRQRAWSLPEPNDGSRPLRGADAALLAIRQAFDHIDADELDEAEKLLSTSGKKLPPSVEAERCSALALLEIRRHRPAEALEHLDRGEAADPSQSTLNYYRAYAYNELRQFDKALPCAQKYVAQDAANTVSHWQLGRALAGLGRLDEAAASFRQGLALNRDAQDNLVALAGVLPADRLPELAQHFRKMSDPGRSLEGLGELLREHRRWDAILVLVDEHRRLSPAHHDNDYYEGLVRHHRDRDYDAAAALFQSGLTRCPREQTDIFAERYYEAMLAARKPLEAYRQAPNAEAAFDFLARSLSHRPGELRQLIALHRQKHPQDARLPRHEATLLERERKFEAAAGLLLQLHAAAEGVDRSELWNEYLYLMVRARKPLEAYVRAADKGQAFRDLVWRLDRRIEALEGLIAAHRATDANDAWLTYAEAVVQRERKDPAQAAKLFERALATLDASRDDDRRGLVLYHYVAAAIEAGQTQQVYAQASEPAAMFQQLARQLSYDDKRQGDLEALIAAHARRQPDDPWLAYYRGVLLGRAKQYAQAADLLKRVLPRVAEGERSFLWQYLDHMQKAGRVLEAYRDVPEAKERFSQFADAIQDPAVLLELIDLRAKDAPRDPWLDFYRARAHRLTKDFAAADKAYAAGLARPDLESWARHRYRSERVEMHRENGRGLSAYVEIDPTRETFQQLAFAYLRQKDADNLTRLVAAHRARDAQDPELIRWDAEILFVKQDYAAGLEFLRRQEGALEKADLEWWRDERLVRALLRLKRFDEALAAAQTASDRRDSRFLEAVVLAVTGRGEAVPLLEELLEEDDDLDAESLYEDEDLGPALRGEAFAAFRQKYPPAASAKE